MCRVLLHDLRRHVKTAALYPLSSSIAHLEEISRLYTVTLTPARAFLRQLLRQTALSLASPTAPSGYDAVILSDLLHFDRSHPELLFSLCALLARRPESRTYVAAGVYTRSEHCDSFLRNAENMGIVWCSSYEDESPEGETDEWAGKMEITGLHPEQLQARKRMCRWWVGRWSEEALAR